jgi:pimeloyl-ACP methyl ester carboxylesterase
MPWRETPEELARARAEEPVVIPTPAGALYGIFTPPAPGAPPADLCTVLLTRPRLHRNRMWIEAARRLAVRGFSCFRFDYHGEGESEGVAAPLDPNRPYREDVLAVMRHLRTHCGQNRFVLSGLCFDARTALSAFAEDGDAVEGLVFMAAPVMELDTMVKVDGDHRRWRQAAFGMLKPESWRALARAERWKYMGTILGRMMARSVWGSERDHPLSPGFVEDFQALVRSRARALFLYGEDDREYLSFRVAERTLLGRLPREVQRRIEIEVWPGVVHHGTLEVARQREILERVLRWILARHPAAWGEADVHALGSAASTSP